MNLTHITIQITTACPLACGQCYMHRGAIAMPLEVFKNAVLQAKGCGANIVQLTGGEPLSHPHVLEMVRFCAESGLCPAISTSGCGADFTALFMLKQAGLRLLCVSLNGSTEEINSKSRQGFLQATDALGAAVAVGLEVFINFVARADNYFNLASLINYARGRGVLGVCILKNFPAADGVTESELSGEQLAALAEAVRGSGGFAEPENCFFKLKRLLYPNRRDYCDAQNRSRFVNVDGTFSACSKLTEVTAQSATDESLLKPFCGG